jgi:hypothetical protein
MGLCGKKKTAESEVEIVGKTYQDYLDERGYKPVCCDNTAEDLWLIFCCFGWLYSFVISYYCLLLKAILQTEDTAAALWMFAYAFIVMVGMTVFAIYANMVGAIPAPEDEEEEVQIKSREIVYETKLTWEVAGHTALANSEEQKKVAANLSLERAESVKKELIANGVNESGLTTYGYGDSKPPADQYDSWMRVEITIKQKSALAQATAAVGTSFEGGIEVDLATGTMHAPAITFKPNSAELTVEGASALEHVELAMSKLEHAA